MKTYSASDLGSHKRTEVFEAAKEGGVIIQKRGTNGKPLDEFVMCHTDLIDNDIKDSIKAMIEDNNQGELSGRNQQ